MLDTDFRNAVLREMIRVMDLELSPESPAIRSSKSPPLRVVTVIYQGTTSASPARRVLVDWNLAFGHRSQYTMLHEKEFLLDLATSFSEKADLGVPSSEFCGVFPGCPSVLPPTSPVHEVSAVSSRRLVVVEL